MSIWSLIFKTVRTYRLLKKHPAPQKESPRKLHIFLSICNAIYIRSTSGSPKADPNFRIPTGSPEADGGWGHRNKMTAEFKGSLTSLATFIKRLGTESGVRRSSSQQSPSGIHIWKQRRHNQLPERSKLFFVHHFCEAKGELWTSPSRNT